MPLTCWWTVTQAYADITGDQNLSMHELLDKKCQKGPDVYYEKSIGGNSPERFPFCHEHYIMFKAWQKRKGLK